MNVVFRNYWQHVARHRWLYLLVLVLITYIGFGKFLSFTFWKDDWGLLWAATYSHQSLRDWLHPGTPIEFLLMTPVAGIAPFCWQILGLTLHVAVALALAVFTASFTTSLAAGMLAGVFYAASASGMDATGWPSAHVILWASLFLLVGLTYGVRYMRKGSRVLLIIALLYLGISISLDPLRVFPIFFLIPLVAAVVLPRTPRARLFLLRIISIEFAGGALLLCLVMTSYLFSYHILGSQLITHLVKYMHQPAEIVRRIYVVGNYFNSLANLMLGWFIRFPEDGSTGVYNPLVARGGFVIFCAMLGIGYRYVQTKSRRIGILLFCLLWMFLFYIPNWLFEPRLTMGITHRYMVISSLGCILLFAYLVSRIRNRTAMILISVFFVGANIIMSGYFLNIWAQYRSSAVVTSLWGAIERDVPDNKNNLIFLYEGEDPLRTYALELSGGAPFALMRKMTNAYDIPIVPADTEQTLDLLCRPGTIRSEPGGMVAQKQIIPLNHVYAWRVTNDGVVTNISLARRKDLLIQAAVNGCYPMVD